MAMLRLARRRGAAGLARLVVSVRSPDDLLYASELPGPDATVIYTRRAPDGAARAGAGWRRPTWPRHDVAGVTAYVCGSSGFADAATDLLIGAGMPAGDIRVERFGPTG